MPSRRRPPFMSLPARTSGVPAQPQFPEAIRLAPGVEVARIDGSKWSVGIRGFGSRLARSVLVLIDGRSVYTPLFAGTYWEVQDTLLEDVDRIEVIRGPAGTCLVKLFAFECLAEFSPILHFAGAVSNCRCRSLRPNLRMFVRI